MDKNLPEEDFSLEDIILEFGSGPDMPPPEPVLPGMTGPMLPEVPDLSEAPAEEPEAEPEPMPKPKKRRLRRERNAELLKREFTGDLYEDDYESIEEKVEDYTFSLEPISQETVALTELPPPPENARSMDEIVRDVERREKSMDRRFYVCIVVTAVNLLLALYSGFSLHWIRGFENTSAMGVISLILMLCAAGTAYDVLFDGLKQLFSTRFGPELLTVVLCIAAIPEAIFAVLAERMPFCALVSLEILCAMFARQRQAETMRAVALVLERCAGAAGVKRVEYAWNGRTAAARGKADVERFETMLEADSVHFTVMRVYVPAALGVCVLFAGLCALLKGLNYFWVFTALLLGALPLGSFLCYVLPYSLLCERLIRRDAALCGWYGAKVLSSCDALFLRDDELFPEGFLKLSGVKTFDQYDSGVVMRYAAAILDSVGCAAAQLLTEEGEALPMVANLRCFDEDGYGAEIGSNTVLLGTLGFMKKMGVHLEHGAKVRQALYLSVNGELAGIIALRYEADPAIRRTLQALSGSGAPTPVLAGSDVLVTPGLLRAKFRLPLERLACPPLRERMLSSDLVADEEDLQGAVIARPGLAVMGAVVLGARAMVTSVRGCVILSVIAGIMSMIVVFLLALSGAMYAVSCVELLGFLLIWLVLFLISAFSVLLNGR